MLSVVALRVRALEHGAAPEGEGAKNTSKYWGRWNASPEKVKQGSVGVWIGVTVVGLTSPVGLGSDVCVRFLMQVGGIHS